MKVLLDHGLPPVLAERLGALGHDVSAAAHPDMAEDDASLLAQATAEHRTLVTQNVGDYHPLLGADPAGSLVIVSPIRYPRSPLTVDRLVFHLDALFVGPSAEDVASGGLHWLETPPGCPFLGPPSARAQEATPAEPG